MHTAPLRGALCAFQHPREPGERELLTLAGRQEGCLHRRQIAAAGIGHRALARRVRTGIVRRIVTNVYLWIAGPWSPWTAAAATGLYLRGDGAISGACAAWLYGIHDTCPDRVEAMVVGRQVRSCDMAVIHRVASLGPEDVGWRRGIPVTTPARTLVDLAAGAAPLEVESALAHARRLRLTTEARIREVIARLPANHPGAPVMRDLLAREPGDLALTRSIYERKLRALVAAARLPLPQTNVHIGPYEADVAYAGEKVVIEFDSWEFHQETFRSDRRRDAWLAANGWIVLRYTADRIDNEPLAVAAEIAATLAIRRAAV